MKKYTLLLLNLFLVFNPWVKATNSIQFNDWPKNPYQHNFNLTYQKYPQLPKGILEAVSFAQTRFTNINEQNTEKGCANMPIPVGIMGLFGSYQSYFRNNLLLVNELSKTKYDESDIQSQIDAYAEAFIKLAEKRGITSENPIDYFSVLIDLSELPITNHLINQFALNSYLYQLYWLLNHPAFQNQYQTPHYRMDLTQLFDPQNLAVLSSSYLTIENEKIYNYEGIVFNPNRSVQAPPDYSGAIWNPTTCNYSSRNGTAISAVTIHTVQGSYSGCISWFKNCSANVSAHYVLRSSDGQVTQMVLESDKAWHVGTENPYTIGLEHEGYINNASWYTTAMYNSSANVVKDICTRRNINPLRTAFWPWSPTTEYNTSNIPGSCSKIKGHQHYPNQTHNDPGANWNWDYYFKLLNPTPSVTTYTASTGTFTDPGGASGDYSNDQRKVYVIQPTNATSVTVTFNSFNLENRWDYLYIYDGATINSPLIGYYTGTTSPGTVTSTGNALTFEFRSDCATTAPGWEAIWNTSSSSNPVTDNINPTTQVAVPNTWVTGNFNATFTDSDNVGGSGIEKSFYQVLEYNGYEYRANSSNGFFSDNFDSIIHPDWTIKTGNWVIENGYLRQKDTTLSNTNIYAYLRQDLSNRYLYNWAQKFLGVNYSGANRRAGFHIMADAPDSSNRGNSYFVWFRLDNDKIQIYKVVNNSWGSGPVVDVPYSFDPNYWYDVKVTFDRITGKMNVYINNILSATYTDSSPHQTGNYISFRTGNSDYVVNNLKVYRSRYSNQATVIKVGPASTNDIRYQNINPNTPAGRVKSITSDAQGNLSSVASADINVDWTAPNAPTVVNDGIGFDIDTTYTNTLFNGNWSQVNDPNSGFKRFWYSIGTSAGDTNIVGWTDHWIYDTLSLSGLNLTAGQHYYLNIKAENNAGLISPIASSDGVLVLTIVTGLTTLNKNWPFFVYPTITDDKVYLLSNWTSDVTINLELLNTTGQLLYTKKINTHSGLQEILSIQALGLSKGVYFIRLNSNDNENNFQKTIKIITN
jgi:N-acetyl-anhydromuramyl-L-alanine amidase AmpD